MRVILGERRVWKGHGSKRQCVTVEDDMMYIPILETLNVLLNSDAVFSEVRNDKENYL